MNNPEGQAKREKLAIILFCIGGLAILVIFFVTTIPNIRNISVPVNEVLRNVEVPVEFRSQMEDIPNQLNQELQEAQRQERLENTFDGLEQRASDPNAGMSDNIEDEGTVIIE